MPPKRYFDAAADDSAAPAAGTSAAAAKAPAPATTIFVSRLPFTATSVDLETLFSDIGPLKRAFVVTDPATKASKGVGYVTFAAPDDAARALREMQGKSLDGGSRKMALSWADEKPSLKERKGKKADVADGTAVAAPAKRPRLAAPATAGTHSSAGPSKDPDAVRTLILSGLAACTPAANDKTIYKRCRKIGDIERVVHPAHDPSNMSGNAKPSPDIAHVIFRTPNHAATAVDKLHAHIFKGAMLSAVLKKRADGAARLEARMRPEKREKLEAAQAKARAVAEAEAKAAGRALTFTEVKGGVNQVSRLILRNLPFDITPADLRAVFLPFGPIHSIDVPQKAAPPTRSQIRAQKRAEDSASDDESSAEDAAEASGAAAAADADRESNAGESSDEEVEVAKPQPAPAAPVVRSTAPTRGRGFAFVWMVSRADAERALNAINGTPIRHGTAERAAVKSAKGKKGRDAAKLALAQAMEGAQPERQVAVDWALSKKDWEQRAEETDADTDAETGKEDESDDESSADAGSDLDPEAVDELMHDGAEDEEDEDDDEEDEEMEAPVKPALPAPEEGTTLFIRNLPYQATEPELRDLFRSFGPLRYAKITMDKATQRSRGTGFVCFWQRESADAALRQARLVESEAGPGARGKPAAPAAAGAKNPFTLPSILTADASAPLTASLTLHGRVLSVTPAVAREQAGSLEAAARAAREKGDKRNTHLMREGVPFPNSPLARDMSESEKEKRLASFGVRKSQLGANPSLFISKTRLSVRQLPLFATDRILKRLAIYAVRHFGLEARAGERTDLSAEEKADRTMSAALTGEDGLPKQKRTERQTAVVQSKVVRQQDRLDPLTGNGRSRGYGFLEMRSFIDALKVIRWANARPEVGKLMQGWWLEELEALVKRLKVAREKQEGNERVETDARLKRLAKRVEELQSGKQVEKAERGGLLQIEFSIENSVVMKKRRERTTAQRAGAAVRSRHAAEDAATVAAGGKPAPRPSREEARRDAKREAKREAAAADEPRSKKHANWNQKARKGAPVEEVKAKAEASATVEEHKAKRDGASHIGAQIGRARAKKQKRA